MLARSVVRAQDSLSYGARFTFNAQRHASAAKARAREPRAVYGRLILQQLDQSIQCADRNLVIVAQAAVRGIHQLAEQSGIDRFDGAKDSVVFADDVARPSPQRL